mmetsp:Transcript_21040/g.41693  ORF Transcript_21040/g.41693 Transcript_21040/m.41693 type:complete len:316 (-) Transcript_21040:782-1729(-)
MSSMSGRTPGPATEKDFDNLVDYSHYVAVTNLRCKGGAEDTAVDEKLFEIAHFMLKSSSWDPFKQSLLAISLIEKKGPEASEMWSKLLFPLERAYDATSGAEFKDRFGHPFFEPQCAVVPEAEEEEEEEDGDDSAPTASSLPVLSLSSPAFSSTSSSMPPPPPPLSSTSFLSAAPTFSAFPSFVISSSESSSPSSPDPTALALKPFTSSSSSASAAPSASPSPLFTAEGRGALTEIAVSVVELLKVKPSCAFFFTCLASSLAAFSRRALAASGCSNPEGNGCLLRSKCFTSSSMLPCFFSILSAVLGPMPGILSQ